MALDIWLSAANDNRGRKRLTVACLRARGLRHTSFIFCGAHFLTVYAASRQRHSVDNDIV